MGLVPLAVRSHRMWCWRDYRYGLCDRDRTDGRASDFGRRTVRHFRTNLYHVLVHRVFTADEYGRSLCEKSEFPRHCQFELFGDGDFIRVLFGDRVLRDLSGADAAKTLVQLIPAWITDGLKFAGGLMPAIGFGILLNIMLRKQYVAYFVLGFLLTAYFKQPLLAVALVGLVFALIEYFMREHIGESPAVVKVAHDEEEGI